MNTDLIIIGGGAAGLMAGATAAEFGLRAVVLERRHQPGRKILMCGNNRCNLSNDLSPQAMLEAFGEPVSDFLGPALLAFPPKQFRNWLAGRGLPTTVNPDGRVYPASEKADDVLHFFTDFLRDHGIPLILNCPATGIVAEKDGFRVVCANLELHAPHVLIATGGVSYPKTGSVGDGQKFAKALGHKVMPYRPGLAGIELQETWLGRYGDVSFMDTALTITAAGQFIGCTTGEILCTRACFRGPAMVNASRLVARQNLRTFELEADLAPGMSSAELAGQIRQRCQHTPERGIARILSNWLVPPEISRDFAERALGLDPLRKAGTLDETALSAMSLRLKHWPLHPVNVRPLKEAMVTIGGVSMDDVDCQTMQSRRQPGLYFAGEVMDIDGPTGGFNLQAAFSTARLAVCTIATKLGKTAQPAPSAAAPQPRPPFQKRSPRRGNRRRTGA